MGNRFSRRREAPTAKAEGPEAEQIAEVETAEESVPECQEAPPNQEETKPEAAEVEAPSPEQHLSPASEPTPPESVGEPAPAAEVQPTIEETETVPEPDPAPCPEAEVIPEPLPEPVPAPEPELEADPPLVNQSVPEPEPNIKPPTSSASPAPLDVDKTAEVEECQDSPETVVVSTLVQKENDAEIFPEKENDDTKNVDEIINDANEENVSELLKQLELTGNDIVADLILSDVKVPDDSPLIDINTSDLMI